MHGYEKYGPNKEQTDLLFRPNPDPYNSASFGETALDTLIDRGEQVARKQWDEILALKKKIGLSDSSDMHRNRLVHSYPVAPTDTFHIRRVLFEGIDPRDEKWLTQISGLKENSLLTVKKLQEAMSIVIGTNL